MEAARADGRDERQSVAPTQLNDGGDGAAPPPDDSRAYSASYPDPASDGLSRIFATIDTTDRLDRALANVRADLSRTRLKALIQGGYVSTAGQTVRDPGLRVKPGQGFDIIIPYSVPLNAEAQAIDFAILFEDDALLVLDKPAGLVVHPGAGQPDGTLVNGLLFHCGSRLSGIGGVSRPGIVHRLDKDTSGLMVVAKTDDAHVGLSAQFADRSLSRTYWAVVRGVPRRTEGELSGAIGRDPSDRKRMAVVRQGGKPALTRYRRVRQFGEAASLLECRLGTGRTHQIRVHLSALGHPVVGDPVYGHQMRRSDAACPSMRGFPRQALHAKRLQFRHPRTGAVLQFDSVLPEDMEDLVADLARLEKPCSGS